MSVQTQTAKIAKQYAEQVVAGDILACRWVQLACQRQLNDLARFKGKGSPYRFNPKLVDRDGRSFHPADNLCAFIERLPHVKGPLAGEPISLEPWQVFILSTVFGWVKSDGKRRFRRSYIEVPRGNAKSTLSSAVALYMLAADREGGAEVYSLATTRDQARIVFGDAQTMARRSPGFRSRFNVNVGAHTGIAVLPLYGVVTQRGNMVDDISGPGSTSTQQFTSVLRQMLADDTVGQILIDIDSPGGSVYGVSELASEIVKARAQKTVIAVANSLAASAAYWIGCSASEFYVTPGGEVGSIGVWQAHFDYSKALEEEGVKPTLISAGKFKVEGNPYVPLDEQAQAFMQSRVDDYYNAFIEAVATGRGVSVADVRTGMGEGRVLGADAALAAGMVDGIATFDDVLARMQKAALPVKPKSASRLGQARNALALLG